MDGGITYDSNSLQTFNPATRVGIVTNSIEHTDLPAKDAAMFGLANRNQSVIPYVGYPAKKVTIAGVIKGSTQADLDSRIDTFKGYFNGKDKNLDIVYNGTTRRYIATANSISIKREQKALWATFSIEFVCPQPFGRNTTATVAVNQAARAASSYTDPHTFLGSAPFQLPKLTVTYATITGGASYVSWGNSTNGQGITITDQTWINGDILEIDCEAQTVKKNGVEIDFLGAFPEFAPGNQSFTYSDGFTTRSMTELVNYYPLWQ